jgi:non-ribosomal peptide synthase protein (TIGR01720 family)
VAVHHLAVDGVSWRILLEDLGKAYRQLDEGAPVQLPARSASFKEWALSLQSPEMQSRCDSELAYWQQQAAPAFRVERPEGRHTEGEVEMVHVQLDAACSARLLQSARVNVRPDELLLASLARVMLPWSGQDALVVELEGHGRPDDPDLTRTVGWFTAPYPVKLSLPSEASAAGQVRHVKASLRDVPSGGIGHGVLRHLRRSLPASPAQLSFNYLGQLDAGLDGSVFAAIDSRSGCLYHPDAPRAVEFDLNCYVLDGRLQIDWSYSRGRWHAGTVEALARRYRDDLALLVDTVTQDGTDLLTPQDFPAVALDATMLEQLLEGME